MLEQKVRVFGKRLAEMEVANENLRYRKPFVIMEKVGEDAWEVRLQASWQDGTVEKMVINPFANTFQAVTLTRELHEISNLKIVTLEDE